MTKQPQEQASSWTYRAFISYSHKDKATAKWLHSSLEKYRLPKNLVGKQTPLCKVPARLTPIFRDQDELPASGSLGLELKDALTKSLFLIVICSPAAAQSKWVNEEIRQFKTAHGDKRVLALIVAGEPNAVSPEQDCFAPALKYIVNAKGEITDQLSEPIAADIRKQADGKRLAKLKLISGLTGLKLDDLVQRDATRRMRTLIQISAASFTASVFAIALAIYANDRRIDANTQRVIAEQEAANTLAVSDFLVDLFASANSSQQNPNDITARSILDTGAKRITAELKGQPLVQSRLSGTIALAFNNLGLFDEAIHVVDSTAAVSGIALAKAYQIKAEALFRKGDFTRALEVLQYAQDLSTLEAPHKYGKDDLETRATIARIQGNIHYELGQHQQALLAYSRALDVLESMQEIDKLAVARVLQTRALLLSDMGQLELAIEDLNNALKMASDSVDSTNIIIGSISLAQAQVNYLSGDLTLAKEQINVATANMARLLDSDNPFLADAISMKGQILHALGDLEEADAALTEAVAIYTKAYGGRHHLSGIAEVYLALIAGDRKDLAASLAHFDEAKLHYDEGYGQLHANHGDLLVNRASVLASMGELERAKVDCAEGMVILNDTLGVDAAFTQQLQAVCDDIYVK